MSEETKYCFRIISGVHSEGGKRYASKNAQKNGRLESHDGDIIHTDNDLLKHNSVGSVKFEKYDDSVESDVDTLDDDGDVNFDKMTKADLEKFASENEIDISEASNKADIVTILKEVWGEDE